jgi:MFS family permease
MGVASTLIGLLPGYDMIGIWAPLLLVVLRLVQGFAAGGELAGATILSAEYAPSNRRGLFGSYAAIGTYSGTVLSSGIFALFSLMPANIFLSWGWRIPFLLSALVVVIGVYIRLQVGETPVFKEAVAQKKTAKIPLLDMLRFEWPRMFLLIGLVAGAFTATYAYQVYSLSYISGVLELPGTVGTFSVMIAAFLAMFIVPLAGYVSDRIGRKPVLVAGALISAAWAFPFFALVNTGNTGLIVVALLGGVGIGVPVILGVQGVVFSELFSTGTRFTGYALSRELGSIAFAGATPFVAASLVGASGGQSWPVSLYVISACVITFVAALFVREQPIPTVPDTLSEVSDE